MEFRPCIDIHNGKVKQIVGSSLKDFGDFAKENFVSNQDAAFYARMYRGSGIRGGHVILLNSPGSEYYEKTREQAVCALHEYPGGLQIGGGITAENASYYIEEGASHVIVTSYVFRNGHIDFARLEKLVRAVGKEHLVLDLSCRKKNQEYYIVTDRWQKFTDEIVSLELMDYLSDFCSEFLIHAVDVEGKNNGMEAELVGILGEWGRLPVTYAGGIRSFEDLKQIYRLGRNRLNVTIGSALDLFGGSMSYEEVLNYVKNTRQEV